MKQKTAKNAENKTKDKNNPKLYTVAVMLVVILIIYLSFLQPLFIFTLLVILPFAIKADMDTSLPICSSLIFILSTVFLYLCKVDIDIFYILAGCTSSISLVCYIVWRYFKVSKFEDGIMCCATLSLLYTMVMAVVIFYIGNKQAFTIQLVDRFQQWLLESESVFINKNLDAMAFFIQSIKNGENATEIFIQASTPGFSSAMTKLEQMKVVEPYVLENINHYCISLFLIYPLIASSFVWWRGNYRLYKNKAEQEERSNLKPKPFSTFSMPRWLAITVMMLLLTTFIAQMTTSEEMVLYAIIVVQDLIYIMFCIQAFAVMDYFLKRIKFFRSAILRLITIGTISLLSFGLVPVVLGSVDILMNIRLVYVQVKEMKEKQNKKTNNNKNKDDKANKE